MARRSRVGRSILSDAAFFVALLATALALGRAPAHAFEFLNN